MTEMHYLNVESLIHRLNVIAQRRKELLDTLWTLEGETEKLRLELMALISGKPITGNMTGVNVADTEPKMTGQEWYDRFEKELGPWPFPSYPSSDWLAALEAAKRAALLMEDKG